MQRPRRRLLPAAAFHAGLLAVVFGVTVAGGHAAAADAATVARGRGGVARRVLRQDPPAENEQPDLGKDLVQDTLDYAWQAAGEATEARAANSQLRARLAGGMAGSTAKATAQQSKANEAALTKAVAEEAKAKAALKVALSMEAEAKELMKDTEEKAYASAKAAAATKLDALQKEAAAYYQSLLDELAALATPTKDAKSDAMMAAAKPYIDTELHVQEMVLRYNTKATETVTAAQNMVNQAFTLAREANYDQAIGNAEMAQRKMIQAHMLVGKANMQEATAKNLRKLAESLNSSIPSYTRAAQMAAIHVQATFAGLQTDKSFQDRSALATRAAAEGRRADEALDVLSGDLSRFAHALQAQH